MTTTFEESKALWKKGIIKEAPIGTVPFMCDTYWYRHVDDRQHIHYIPKLTLEELLDLVEEKYKAICELHNNYMFFSDPNKKWCLFINAWNIRTYADNPRSAVVKALSEGK